MVNWEGGFDAESNTQTFLGRTSMRSGPNSGARLALASLLTLLTGDFIDYHPNANRKWCVGKHGRGYMLREAACDAWRKRRLP